MGSTGRSPFHHRRRQATHLARRGAAFAIEQRVRPLRWLGPALGALGAFPLVQGPRWVGVLLVATGATIWFGVSVVVRRALRILTPPAGRASRPNPPSGAR